MQKKSRYVQYCLWMREGGREGGRTCLTFNSGTISCAVAPRPIPTFPA